MGDRILYYAMPLLKLLLFAFLCIVCFVPTSIILQFNFVQQIQNELITDIIAELGLCLAVIGGLLMVFRLLKQYSFSALFMVSPHSISGFFKGGLIGLILIFSCASLTLLNGNVIFSLGDIKLSLIIAYVVFYIFVAVFEELFFRTFPLFIFAERYPIGFAIFLSSTLFGLAHIGNDGFSWLAMLNISLAGALFAIFTLQKMNISWAIGIHFGWNFTQGTILGYEVSGGKSPGILVAKPVGEAYLSGGTFGIESSVFCTALLVILIVFLLIKNKIEPVQELVFVEELEEETSL